MIKSPIFYMGNKFDLLDNLLAYFPKKEQVDLFIDLFGGSGVVSLNVPYDNIIYNELNENVYNLYQKLANVEPDIIINHIRKNIKQFNLPTTEIVELSKSNANVSIRKGEKEYYEMRTKYNETRDYKDLLTLMYYSFGNQLRFNKKGEFNMPYGNRKWLDELHSNEIISFYYRSKVKKIKALNLNAFDVLSKIKENKNQFIYLDPPYSNTLAIYNEQRANGGWTIDDDNKLFEELNRLNDLGIKWAMSNVLENKGVKNTHIEKWAVDNNYKIIDFHNKEYAALGKGSANTREVLIVNYQPSFEQYNIFDFIDESK